MQNRRTFIKNTSTIISAIATGNLEYSFETSKTKKNKLPQWKGFNVLDFFSPKNGERFDNTKEDYFKWMQDWGFDFVRLPMAYPHYLKFDRTKPITIDSVRSIDTEATDKIEQLIYLAQKYNHHVSINLHRAPGYCINAGFQEPYNLWKDQQAEDDFCFHWDFWAKKFKNISNKKISFDLLNEPSWRDDMNDQHGKKIALPGETYKKLVLAGFNTIKAINKKHLVIADGNNIGNNVTPELADLDIAQSCRGYAPGSISHYKANWASKDINTQPIPLWPGQVGNQYLSKKLLEDLYAPWIELVKNGKGVHCGECGCYNKTPHNVFLAWFSDVIGILSEHKIGFALWGFTGAFGILNSDRADVNYVDWYGHKLDKKLLDLIQKI